MTQETNGKRDAKHIQVELTADGARVTGLSLQGSRLFLTIEADLAGSALSTGDDQTPPAPPQTKHIEMTPPPGTGVSIPISDAAAGTPSHIGHFTASFPPEDPAPAPGSDETETKELADIDRETVMMATRPSGVVELNKVYSTGVDSLTDAAVSTTDILGSVRGEDVMMAVPASGANVRSAAPVPPAPPAEGPGAAGAVPEPGPAPASGAAPAAEKRAETSETPRYADAAAPDSPNQRRYNTGATPITPTDLRDLLPPEMLIENEQEMPTVELPSPYPPPPAPPVEEREEIAAPEPMAEMPEPEAQAGPQVMRVTPDIVSDSEAREDDEASWREIDIPVISEESNIMGGDRHGEPMPAMAFGLDLSDPKPVAEAAAATPPPPPPQAEPTPEPEPEPEPAAPPPLPEPEPQAAPSPLQDDEKPANTGTTVLIRYTCPRCKTQGMQAVDKVGTVVNCSNCGKPMRLVMKK